jgi:hypothetical protein
VGKIIHEIGGLVGVPSAGGKRGQDEADGVRDELVHALAPDEAARLAVEPQVDRA